jgi:hypothetical protein
MQTRTIRMDGNSDGKNIQGKNMGTETARQSGPCWNPSGLKLGLRLFKPASNRFQTGVALDLTRLSPAQHQRFACILHKYHPNVRNLRKLFRFAILPMDFACPRLLCVPRRPSASLRFSSPRSPETSEQLLVTNYQSPAANRPNLHPTPPKPSQLHNTLMPARIGWMGALSRRDSVPFRSACRGRQCGKDRRCRGQPVRRGEDGCRRNRTV